MSLPIYFDIDGTLTDDSRAHHGIPVIDRIEQIHELANLGHEIVIWTATGTKYAKAFAERHGLIDKVVCIGKPKICIDDKPKIRTDGLNIVSPQDYFGA